MLARRVQVSSKPVARTASLLSEAGLMAYQKALREHLPLAHIAEQSERPQYWFANNILQVVGVYGTAPGEDDLLHITRTETNGLKLIDDMTALIAPGVEQRRYEGLHVTTGDLEKYMEWARTVY